MSSFDKLLAKVSECSPKKVAVAVAQDEPVLEAIREAKERKIADAILVGDKDKIAQVAAKIGMNLDDYEIVHEPHDTVAALKAVELVHDKKADTLMKGLVPTKTFLKSVLDKEVGLRTGQQMSHVSVFDIEGINRLLFLTDVAFNTYPNVDDKVKIIENAAKVAQACGVENPKVAGVCAVEVVNPAMQCTVDAAELTERSKRGEIKGCVVEGPFSLDIAIDSEAAAHKGVKDSQVAGVADILLLPDIDAGNIMYKCITHTTNARNGCVLVGTSAPVILTSRADSFETKVNSIALAAVVAENMK